MCFLWHIFVDRLLCYGIDTRHQIIKLELTAISCCYGLIDTITGNREVDTVDLSVLTGLYNLAGAIADFHLHISTDRIANFLCIGNNVLHTGTCAMFTLGPHNHTSADRVFLAGSDRKGIAWCFLHRYRQLIPICGKGYPTDTCTEAVIREYVICICQCCCVFASIPLQFQCFC